LDQATEYTELNLFPSLLGFTLLTFPLQIIKYLDKYLLRLSFDKLHFAIIFLPAHLIKILSLQLPLVFLYVSVIIHHFFQALFFLYFLIYVPFHLVYAQLTVYFLIYFDNKRFGLLTIAFAE